MAMARNAALGSFALHSSNQCASSSPSLFPSSFVARKDPGRIGHTSKECRIDRICRRAIAEQEDEQDPSSSHYTYSGSSWIFVANLSWSCKKAEVMELLQHIGISDDVEQIDIVYNKDSGQSRGFAYLGLKSVAAAEAAISKIDGYIFEGRFLKAGMAHPAQRDDFSDELAYSDAVYGSSSSSCKVYIGNLPFGVDDSSLEEFFQAHGNVVDAKVIYDRSTGRSRGFGFVTLSSQREAQQAVDALNGVDCDGRALRVQMWTNLR